MSSIEKRPNQTIHPAVYCNSLAGQHGIGVVDQPCLSMNPCTVVHVYERYNQGIPVIAPLGKKMKRAPAYGYSAEIPCQLDVFRV